MSDYTKRYGSAVHDVEAWLRDEARRSRGEHFEATAREFERIADQLADFELAPRTPAAAAQNLDGYERASNDLEQWMHLEAQDARGTHRGVRLEWVAQAIASRTFRPS